MLRIYKSVRIVVFMNRWISHFRFVPSAWLLSINGHMFGIGKSAMPYTSMLTNNYSDYTYW